MKDPPIEENDETENVSGWTSVGREISIADGHDNDNDDKKYTNDNGNGLDEISSRANFKSRIANFVSWLLLEMREDFEERNFLYSNP